MAEELDVKKMHDTFMESCKDNEGNQQYKELTNDVVNYVVRQINEFSKLGSLNDSQYQQMLKESEQGLFILIFLSHYKEGEDLIDKEPISISGINFLRLMYSMVYKGGLYKLQEKEIMAKQPINVMSTR